MIFEEAVIAGVWRVELQPHTDERGLFARAFCGEEFEQHGLPSVFEQSSLSRNTHAGTLRGMHYQAAPHAEAKFVRCVRGAVFDVAVDLRRNSPTYLRWVGETLSAENGLGLYVAPGLAHGFVTLVEDSDVLYQITPAYATGRATGVRWNDPAFDICWPRDTPFMSERDAHYPDWIV